MSDGERARTARLRQALLWVLLWTGLGLFFASEAAIRQYPGRERALPWSDALLVNIPFYLIWGALALGVLRLARAFPIAGSRRQRARSVLVHLGAGLVAAALQLVLAEVFFELVRQLRARDVTYLQALAFSFRHNFHVNLLTYWAIVALRHLREYDRGLREKELVAARLEQQLAGAQLAALRMQLQPHFLFNALHSISALLYESPEAADRMLVRLSDLLRQSLETGGEQEVRLGQELDFVNRYLDLERMRYSDRLEVETAVDPFVVDAAVPAFVLQPLVENALVHGLGSATGASRLSLRARRERDVLVLEVENGCGPRAPRPSAGTGVGLQNTRARLAQLYGDAAHLELDLDPARAVARVTLPYRELGGGPAVSPA